MFKSNQLTDHKHLEDIHEESLQIPRQINRFLCNRPDGPLKESGRQSNTIRMLGQASPISTRSWISCSDTDRETATVRTEGQHRPDAFLVSKKIYARISVFLS